MSGNKYPVDFFVPPDRKPKNRVHDLGTIAADPLSAMKDTTRSNIFATTKVNPKERLVEVIAVDNDIKMPSDINLGHKQLLDSYGTRTFVCVIGRMQDMDGAIPDPDSVVDLSTGNIILPTKDVTRIRNHTGKFYAPLDDLKGKMVGNIQVGDVLLVEFQDKITMSSGIIKEVFIKKDVNSYIKITVTGGGGTGGGGAGDSFSDTGVPADPGGAQTGPGLFIGASMSKPIGTKACGKASTSTSIAGTNLQCAGTRAADLLNGGGGAGCQLLGLKNALVENYAGIANNGIIINIGGNDGFNPASVKKSIGGIHEELKRLFPQAQYFWIMKSPNHGNNISKTGNDIDNFYVGPSSPFRGFSPPFRVINQGILMPEDIRMTNMNNTAFKSFSVAGSHAASAGSWDWPGTNGLISTCANILKNSVSGNEYTQL